MISAMCSCLFRLNRLRTWVLFRTVYFFKPRIYNTCQSFSLPQVRMKKKQFLIKVAKFSNVVHRFVFTWNAVPVEVTRRVRRWTDLSLFSPSLRLLPPLSVSVPPSIRLHSGSVPAGGTRLRRDGRVSHEEDGMACRGRFGEAQGRHGGAHHHRFQNGPQG